MDKLYTVDEVKDILKVSENTVRRYLSEGKLKYVKVFGNTRITEEELKKHIKPVAKDDKQNDK